MLAKARSEIKRLEEEREKAIVEYLRTRADEYAAQYKLIFQALCRAHDQLVGISNALLARWDFPDIRMGVPRIEVPRFNLPSMAFGGEATIGHLAVDATVEDATANWLGAMDRLINDADAPLDDLLGPQISSDA
jgi:hypothetical protein